MLDHFQFQAHPLFQTFVDPKYPIEIVDEFLSIAEAELTEHRTCLGVQYNRCAFLLTAHRLSAWNANGLLAASSLSSLEVLPVSEMRKLVSTLSVSDEAGSESITFQPNTTSSIDGGADDLTSTEYGRMYLSLFNKYRCPRSWMVT